MQRHILYLSQGKWLLCGSLSFCVIPTRCGVCGVCLLADCFPFLGTQSPARVAGSRVEQQWKSQCELPRINKKCLLCKDAKANRFITGQPHSLVQCIIRCFSQGSPLRVFPCVIMQLSPLLNGGPFAQTHSPSLQALSEVCISPVSLSSFLFFLSLFLV